MTIKLNKIYAKLEAWRGERSNLTGPRHCERSEAIPFKVKKLNNEIASSFTTFTPRNDGIFAMTEFRNDEF